MIESTIFTNLTDFSICLVAKIKTYMCWHNLHSLWSARRQCVLGCGMSWSVQVCGNSWSVHVTKLNNAQIGGARRGTGSVRSSSLMAIIRTATRTETYARTSTILLVVSNYPWMRVLRVCGKGFPLSCNRETRLIRDGEKVLPFQYFHSPEVTVAFSSF